MTGLDPCCEGPVNTWDADLQQDAWDDSDPTMASCCQRELEQQKKAAGIVRRLKAADRIHQRAELQAKVIAAQPPASESSLETDSDEGEEKRCSRKFHQGNL